MTGYVGGDPYESPTFGKALSLRVDGGVNAISINPSGRDVVLASRQGLHVIDLDDPFSPPRWLRHITPWQVADVQWSPHPAKPHWVVSTSNQKAIIWNLARSSSDAIEHVLHKHFRAITDINFNHQHPDILATCSIDTYVHAWDMRSPSRPFYTTREWVAGASQVKWSFKDQNVLASAHGNEVSIWDLRKGSTPLGKLLGHESGVNSIDFNRFKNDEIMTASNDGTVKFWDYSVSCTEAKRTIRTDFPIWRGRYLPFGEGCCLLPTIGGGDSVYLASLANSVKNESSDTKLQPIYAFKGHTNRVIDFLWRSRSSSDAQVDDREFQLVTWSKDCDLRLWPVPNTIYDKVNLDRSKRLEETFPSYEYMTYNKEPADSRPEVSNDYRRRKEKFVTSSGIHKNDDVNYITWLSGVRMNHTGSPENIFTERTIQNLGEEVSSIGHKFPKIIFEKISVSTGELIITLNGPWSDDNPEEYVFLRIDVKVPTAYPSKGNSPQFSIEDNGNLKQEQREEISRKLEEIANKYTDSGMYCLEPCLRLLLGETINLDDLNQEIEPILNFEITDQIGLENLSSLPSSDGTSQYLSDTSSETQSDHYKAVFDSSENKELRNPFGRDLTFDSTPVPNECGAVWTPTGQLLCFFMSESNLEKKQQTMLRLTGKSRHQKEHKTGPRAWESKDNPAEKPARKNSTRPKRYVETISTSLVSSKSINYSSDDQDSDGYSTDSFDNDWSDILRNEVVVRTKLPPLHGTFTKKFTSVHSDSAKTMDSWKKLKNIIFIKDFSHLISDRKELALEYHLTNSSLEQVARNNALVAEKYNLDEISHCWQVLSDMLMTKEISDPYDLMWDNHPMGIRWFVKEAIKFFEKKNNLQMLAMLCCVVASQATKRLKTAEDEDESRPLSRGKVESLVTFRNNDTMRSVRADLHSHYSSSLASSSLEGLNKNRHSPDEVSVKSEDYFSARHQSYNVRTISSSPPLPTRSQQPFQSRLPDLNVRLIQDEVLDAIDDPERHLLDPEDAKKFRFYSYQYAKLLYRWDLPMERVKILKISFSTNSTASDIASQMIDENKDLFGGITTTWEANDERSIHFQNCNYCGLKVTRSIFVCQICEHIMHSTCATEWWQSSQECASGCGCYCPEAFPM